MEYILGTLSHAHIKDRFTDARTHVHILKHTHAHILKHTHVHTLKHTNANILKHRHSHILKHTHAHISNTDTYTFTGEQAVFQFMNLFNQVLVCVCGYTCEYVMCFL